MDNAQLAQLYQEKFDSNFYLENYLGAVHDFDKFICTHLYNAFEQGKLKGPRCVDIGGGPLIHRLSYASRVCDQVFHADFTDGNRELVRQWLTTKDLDQKHRHLTQFAAQLEGYKNEEEGALIIEDRLRSRLVATIPVNILNEEPIENLDKLGGPFDCALSSACIESVCSSYEEYVQVAKNIRRLLKPGAGFFLTGFLNGDFYRVSTTTFPCLKWDSEMVKKGIEEAGYRLEFLEVMDCSEQEQIVDDAPSNCNAIFVALSYKNG